MPTHEELARFLRQFNKLSLALRSSFIAAALALAEDLGDRGFDPTAVRPPLRLHKLSGENVWSVSFASTGARSTLSRTPARVRDSPASSYRVHRGTWRVERA